MMLFLRNPKIIAGAIAVVLIAIAAYTYNQTLISLGEERERSQALQVQLDAKEVVITDLLRREARLQGLIKDLMDKQESMRGDYDLQLKLYRDEIALQKCAAVPHGDAVDRLLNGTHRSNPAPTRH